jgi:hypothetical protein
MTGHKGQPPKSPAREQNTHTQVQATLKVRSRAIDFSKSISTSYGSPAAMRTSTLTCVCIITLLFASAGLTFAQQSSSASPNPKNRSAQFRLEVIHVANGAELLTIWFSTDASGDPAAREIPLLSVLRDTLGDGNPENDLLRQVWVYTYTHPSLRQRAAALVPFLYKGINRKRSSKRAAPPAIIDLSDTENDVWKSMFWSGLTTFPALSPLVNVVANTYRHNAVKYRTANVFRALAVLSSYQADPESESGLSQHDLKEMQSRLMLSLKTFGGLVDETNLQHFYDRETIKLRDWRGHNFELLRQQAEASGLYFEPLTMPDGSVTHALLWIARSYLSQSGEHRYEGRFLNLKNPWQDANLRKWRGYTEIKYFSGENRPVSPNTVGAHSLEMIPLAAYGFDFPKIPTLLIDFRDDLNPKKRELSRQVIDDVAKNVLSVSRLGNLYYGAGRTALDFVTGRRGIDFNQPSRVRSLVQLKLLLSLNPEITPSFRKSLDDKVERLTSNPLVSSEESEPELARGQYESLAAYALRNDGLPTRLQRDRGEEMTRFVHGATTRSLLRLANIFTLGIYTHREKMTSERMGQLDIQRRLAYHTRFLRETAKSSPIIEVTSNLEEVRRSLSYISENGSVASDKSVQALVKIFNRTLDVETRQLCLRGLKMIGNKSATRELAQITRDESLDLPWRQLSEQYLNVLMREKEKSSEAPANLLGTMVQKPGLN